MGMARERLLFWFLHKYDSIKNITCRNFYTNITSIRPSTLGYEIATPTELPEGSPILAFPKGKEHNVNGFVYEWTFVLS